MLQQKKRNVKKKACKEVVRKRKKNLIVMRKLRRCENRKWDGVGMECENGTEWE